MSDPALGLLMLGLIVVVMILLLGQSRVAFAMARDGLFPVGAAAVHPRPRGAGLDGCRAAGGSLPGRR